MPRLSPSAKQILAAINNNIDGLTDHSETLQSHDLRIGSNTQNITNLSQQVASNDDDIQTHKNRLDGHDSTIQTHENRLDGHDTDIANKADKGHKHSASDITSGTMSSARLPSATTLTVGAVQLSDSITGTSTTKAATENAVRKAAEKSAEIYLGTEPKNTDYPIGSFVSAMIPSGQNVIASHGNKQVTLHLSTYSTHDFYVVAGNSYAGTALNGTWAYRGRCGTSHNTALGLYQRVS